jgi:4-hydroxy-3-methylbut-2-en-1-yl diphosphate synthase IspG/GcpE
MTSTEGRLKWITIVQQLRFNPGKFVRCPFCGASDLDVIDVSEDAESSVQWIACPKCNEATTLRSS